VWLYDWERDAMTRLTFGGTDNYGPEWSPDGQSLAFVSDRAPNRVRNVFWQRADGSGHAVALTSGEVPRSGPSWHPSGRFLAIQENTQESRNDVTILRLEGDSATGWTPGAMSTFVKTSAVEMRPRFSPDGRWLAYESDESGRPEIYVRPFPGPGGRWQVSTSGGMFAQWSQRRRELVYRSADQRLMLVPFSVSGDQFVAGKPVDWAPRDVTYIIDSYALHPDGDRVVTQSAPPTVAAPTAVTLVTNLFDELRRLVPTGK
jgi:serine/threonine-protein kinase